MSVRGHVNCRRPRSRRLDVPSTRLGGHEVVCLLEQLLGEDVELTRNEVVRCLNLGAALGGVPQLLAEHECVVVQHAHHGLGLGKSASQPGHVVVTDVRVSGNAVCASAKRTPADARRFERCLRHMV